MKQFLYLDTDIVNSIIAQSEKGIITGFSMLTCTNVILQATWNATPPTETASRCCSLSFAICPVSSDLTRRCSCKTSAAR